MPTTTENCVTGSRTSGSELDGPRLTDSWFTAESVLPTKRITAKECDANRLEIEPTQRIGRKQIADTVVLISLLAAGCGAVWFLGMMAADAYAEFTQLNPVSHIRVMGGMR